MERCPPERIRDDDGGEACLSGSVRGNRIGRSRGDARGGVGRSIETFVGILDLADRRHADNK
ncbi:MAG TPA: hypothetical protein VFS62_16655 [Chloroflexota bacterium]|nr:hypothetical protein [Chloroflexota bacterium]